MTATETIAWQGGVDGHLRLIDQTELPTNLKQIDCRTIEQVWTAIRRLRVRGAPAIGIAAAYGVCLAVSDSFSRGLDEARHSALEAADYLASSRPTAVNLFWALDRMRKVIRADYDDVDSLASAMFLNLRGPPRLAKGWKPSPKWVIRRSSWPPCRAGPNVSL